MSQPSPRSDSSPAVPSTPARAVGARSWSAGLALPSHLRRDLVEVLVLFVTLRVVLGLFGMLLWHTQTLAGPCHFEIALDGWTVFPPIDDKGIAFPLVGIWQRWDGCWYTNIAANGYVMKESVSFWPLFPAFTSAAGSLLGGDVALGGLVVNGIAYILAMVGLMGLVRADFNRRVASRTVLFISVFPAAFFFLAPFTEAVFLACTVWAVFGARRRLWVLAGVAAVLAGFSRTQGIFLVLPLGWEALRFWWEKGLPAVLRESDATTPARVSVAQGARDKLAGFTANLRRWRLPAWTDLAGPAVVVALPALSFMAFVEYAKSTVGQSPFDSQNVWGGANFHAPWETLQVAWTWAFEHHNAIELLNVIVLAIFLVAVVIGLFKLPLSYSLVAIPQVLIAAMRIQPTPLTSTLRLMLVVFPVFVLIALGCKNRRIEQAWLLLSTVLLAYLVSLYFKGDFVA